jgi:predicted nucleic acid-binding protein
VIVYVDTSALMKLVRVEEHTASMRRWLTRHDPTLITSVIGAVELRRAVARVGPTLLPVAEGVLARMRLVELTEAVLALAGAVAPPELRTLDALHLASAVMVADLDTVLCYDRRLGAAFERIGITVAAPEGPAGGTTGLTGSGP